MSNEALRRVGSAARCVAGQGRAGGRGQTVQ